MSKEGEEKICERMKKHKGRAINCFPMMVSLETAEEREKCATNNVSKRKHEYRM